LGNDLFVVVAQEREIQPHLFGKSLVAKRSISADANNLCV
jgi:hypothetical protein